MKKNYIFLLIMFIILNGFSQDTPSKNLTNDLNEIYKQEHIVGFSVAIVNDQGFLYNKSFGYADKKNSKEYSEKTIQNIASVSKTFIGIALLKGQELGILSIDDPINKHLPFEVHNPYFPEKEITIKHLATHTSGIKDPKVYDSKGYILKEFYHEDEQINSNFLTPNNLMTLRDYQEQILSENGKWYQKKTFHKSAPGYTFEYTNIGAGLAALVIESASGVSFKEFTHKHILTPLQMTQSGWDFKEVDFSQHSKLYANATTELAFYQLNNYPDGGFTTSTHDLGLYLTELMKGYNGNGTILSKSSYELLYKPNLNNKIHPNRNPEKEYNDEYDMGVFMGLSAKDQIGHTGGDPGVATFMFFNPVKNIGKILFVNTDLSNEGVNEFISIWSKLIEFEEQF